jgi:hypothetical protein
MALITDHPFSGFWKVMPSMTQRSLIIPCEVFYLGDKDTNFWRIHPIIS